MARLLDSYSPKLVFSFGAFAFEFARRSRDDNPHRPFNHWSTARLGQEFRRRIVEFTKPATTLIPLLHVSIARRHFLQSHKAFTQMEDGNYFEYVAREIASCLSKHRNEFPIL